jgi:hypothetical protein
MHLQFSKSSEMTPKQIRNKFNIDIKNPEFVDDLKFFGVVFKK